MGLIMRETKTKRHRIKTPAVLSRIVIFLFLLMIMLFVNINSITYLLNSDSYETVSATVVQSTTDKFLLLIPAVELNYHYSGEEYTERKLFILESLFGLSDETGTKLILHVNKTAPNHCLIDVSFFKNIVNWILLILEFVCIYNLIQRIKIAKQEKEVLKNEKEMA